MSFLLPEPRLRRLVQLLAGLVLFGFSLSLLVRADLGLPPWDVLHQGIAESIDLPLGSVVIATSVVVLLLWIPLRERMGIGTVSNAVLVGLTLEAGLLFVDEPDSTVTRWLLVVVGVVMNGIGTGLYISAGLGPGPRDGLMTGIAKRGQPIRVVRTGIEVIVLGLGFLLGGTVGWGTLVFAAAIGPLVHVFLPTFVIGSDRQEPAARSRPPRRRPQAPPERRPSAPDPVEQRRAPSVRKDLGEASSCSIRTDEHQLHVRVARLGVSSYSSSVPSPDSADSSTGTSSLATRTWVSL